MIYLLHAVALVAGLLLAAVLVACASRHRRRWLRWVWPALLGALPAAYFALLLTQDGVIREARFSYAYEPTLFVHLCALALGYAGILPLSLIGITRRRGEELPRARSWRLGRLVLSLCLLPVLWMLALMAVDWNVRAKLRTARIEPRQYLAQIHQGRLPDDGDAFPLYRRAYSNLLNDPSPIWKADVDDPSLDVRAPEVVEVLKRHAEALELVLEASRLPLCHLTNDFDSGDPNQRHGMSCIRRLLGVALWARRAEGDAVQALELDAAIGRLVRQFEDNPHLLWQMWALGLQRDRVIVFERETGEERTAVLHLPLPVEHDTDSHTSGIADAIDLFAAQNMEMFTAVALGEASLLDEGVRFRTGEGRLAIAAANATMRVFRADQHLKSFPAFVDRARLAAEELPGQVDVGDTANRYSVSPLQPEGKFEILACAEAELLLDARRWSAQIDRSLTVAWAAEAYREQRGAYPQVESDLVPEFLAAIPLDPDTGEPVRLVAFDDQALVYGGAWKLRRRYHVFGAVCLGGAHEVLRKPGNLSGGCNVIVDYKNPVFALLERRQGATP